MANPEAWVCPHCSYAQMLPPAKAVNDAIRIEIDGLAERHVLLEYEAKGCSNPACLKLTFSCGLFQASYTRSSSGNHYYSNGTPALAGATFLPKGSSKPQPPYIPRPLVADYEEACAIRDLSPKASATLVRRCLQGMIRDFCGIKDDTLNKEIRKLRRAIDGGEGPKGVDPETVDAIDHVRSIGNIGAHMEKDINVIVDVDANEAQTLINLVEMLFREWYVAAHRRSESFAAIKALSSEKEDDRRKAPQSDGVEEIGAGVGVEPALDPASTKG